jgi:hypothetical protein
MILNIKTTTGTIQAEVHDSREAACMLVKLAREGLKCVRWEVAK